MNPRERKSLSLGLPSPRLSILGSSYLFRGISEFETVVESETAPIDLGFRGNQLPVLRPSTSWVLYGERKIANHVESQEIRDKPRESFSARFGLFPRTPLSPEVDDSFDYS